MRRKSGDIARTQREAPKCPGVDERYRPDPSLFHPAAGHRLGHDGNADAALDHAAHRLQAGDPHPEFDGTPDASRLDGEMSLERTAVCEADEGLAQGVPKGDALVTGEGMMGGNDQDELVRSEGERLQVGGIRGVGDNAEVGETARDCGHDIATRPLLKIHVDVRVFG